MSGKKWYILFFGIIILVLLTLILKPTSSTFGKRDKISSFTKSGKATAIQIKSKESALELYKNDGNWYTQDNTPANNELVNKLFNALSNIQIQSSVLKKNYNVYNNVLSDIGITVKIMSGDREIYSILYAHYQGRDFAISENGSMFFIDIRGSVYKSINEAVRIDAEDWYDKLLINLKPNEIVSVLVEYPGRPSSSFKLIRDSVEVNIYNYANNVIEDYSALAIQDYMSFFSGIKYETIDTTLQIPNSEEQLFRLHINTNISKTFNIEGFALVDKANLTRDNSKFAAIINGAFLVKLDYSDFDPIVVDKQYFLKK